MYPAVADIRPAKAAGDQKLIICPELKIVKLHKLKCQLWRGGGMPFNSEIIPDATRPQTRSKNHIYFPPIHPFNNAIPYEEIYGISTEILHLLNDW